MKNKISNASKNIGINGQFRSLNNNEMHSLKGGGAKSVPPIPPIPSSGGEDFPLSVASIQQIPMIVSVPKNMPPAASNAAVYLD